MFLDLAYTVRALLKQAGYEQPDVVGLFLLPPVEGNRTLALGNACAALRELSHFATPGTTFAAQYHPREAAIQDSEPPFGRCVMLPLPDETDEQATREVIEQAGLFLARDLGSPLGRAADLARGGLTGVPWESRGLFCQTFGLYSVSVPRHALRRDMARRLGQRLMQRWMSKDSKPLRASVGAWMQEQGTQQELDSNVLMERLSAVGRQVLGREAEDVFRDMVEPLWEHTAGPAPAQIAEILAQFEQLLGKPHDTELDERMEAMLKKRFTALVNVCLLGGNVLKNVATAMRRTAEEFIALQVGELNTSEMFLEHHTDAARAADEIASFFDKACPKLSGERRGPDAELCVLATPSGSAGDRFRELARQARPDIEWHFAPGDEDILLYRERTNLPLAELPHLGPLARDAYRQMSAAEHFTPHCRTDVDFGAG